MRLSRLMLVGLAGVLFVAVAAGLVAALRRDDERAPAAASVGLTDRVVVPPAPPGTARHLALPPRKTGIAPASYPRISASFISHAGSSADWSWIAPDYPGARFDPDGTRNGHGGRTITWWYNPAGGRGKVTAGTIRRGLAPVTAVTGFRFQHVRARSGADVTLLWRRIPHPGVVALSSPSWRWEDPDDRALTIDGGHVWFNRRSSPAFPYWKQTVMHEIGHVMGLGHATETTQVMDPIVDGTSTWGRGDVHALHHVSAYLGEVR